MIVPEGKTIYHGSRKFISGEELPPHVMLDMPVLTKKQANSKAKKESGYKRRSKRGKVHTGLDF